jgi:hypothetical protein
VPSTLHEGTTTPTVGSGESTLQAAITTAGTYLLWVSPRNMADLSTPPILEVRIWGKVLSTDVTEELLDAHSFVGKQSRPIITKPYVSTVSIRFALAMPTGSGTAVAFPWSIRSV